MKNKILMFLCALMLCVTTFGLTACGGGSSSTGKGGNSSLGDSTSSGNDAEEYDPTLRPPVTDPPKGDSDTNSQNFEDYFSGYRVLVEGDGSFKIKDDATGEQKTFNELLDRQISTLAEDIMYRLYCVYGTNAQGQINNINGGQAKSLYNGYKYEESGAFVNRINLLVNDPPTTSNFNKKEKHDEIVEHNRLSNSFLPHIDCIYCYQNLVLKFNVEGFADYLYSDSGIMIPSAIDGKYVYNPETTTFEKNTEYAWLKNNDELFKNNATLNYSNNLNNAYLLNFKMAIAKMLTGEDYLSPGADSYSANDYNNLLNRINKLGYNVKPTVGFDTSFKYDDDKMLEYIEKRVIGEKVINKSNDAYSLIENDNQKGNIGAWTEEKDIDKYYFGGYNIVLKAIVKKAFTNTFGNTNISLYPNCSRTNILEGTFETKPGSSSDEDDETGMGGTQEMTTTGPVKFSSIILKPKDGVLLNEIILSVACARDTEPDKAPEDIESTRYKKDIVVEFKVNMEYKTSKGEGFNQIVTASKEDEVLTIDSAGYVPEPPTVMGEVIPLPDGVNTGYLPFQFSFSMVDYLQDPPPSFGEYNGSKETLADMSLWNNAFKPNATGTALTFNAGDNYLQITFVDVVVKQRTNTGLVPYTGNDVVYDISLMPLNF